MKKLIVLIMVMVAFVAFTPAEQKVNVQLDKQRAERAFTQLQAVYTLAEQSNLPHQQVRFIQATCDTLLAELAMGYQNSFKADSATQKKK